MLKVNKTQYYHFSCLFLLFIILDVAETLYRMSEIIGLTNFLTSTLKIKLIFKNVEVRLNVLVLSIRTSGIKLLMWEMAGDYELSQGLAIMQRASAKSYIPKAEKIQGKF